MNGHNAAIFAKNYEKKVGGKKERKEDKKTAVKSWAVIGSGPRVDLL